MPEHAASVSGSITDHTNCDSYTKSADSNFSWSNMTRGSYHNSELQASGVFSDKGDVQNIAVISNATFADGPIQGGLL